MSVLTLALCAGFKSAFKCTLNHCTSSSLIIAFVICYLLSVRNTPLLTSWHFPPLPYFYRKGQNVLNVIYLAFEKLQFQNEATLESAFSKCTRTTARTSSVSVSVSPYPVIQYHRYPKHFRPHVHCIDEFYTFVHFSVFLTFVFSSSNTTECKNKMIIYCSF